MTFEDQLQELGLSPSEASIYTTLVERGPLGASALAEVAGLSRQSVYAATRGLADKGMVEAGAGYAQRFRAIDPEEALPYLIERDRELLQAREVLAKELSQLLPRPTEDPTDTQEVVEIIKNPRAAAERLTRLQLEARSSIDWLVKAPIVLNQREDPPSMGALERGVQVRSVYERDVLEDDQVQPYIHQWTGHGEQARVSRSELPLKLALFDGEVGLMPLETPRQIHAVTFIVIHHEALGAALQTLFNYLWRDAAPLSS